jgi:hypothetical protein
MHTILIPTGNLMGAAESLLVAEATQLHLYCPVCGEVWAHALNAHPRFSHFYTQQRCEAHGNGLLYPFFDARNLPHDLLMREFLIETSGIVAKNPNGLPMPYTGKAQFPPNPIHPLGESL